MGHLVDAGGSTGGIEELAEAWKGVLKSADNRPVGHLGTLERVTHHHSGHLNITRTFRHRIVSQPSLVLVSLSTRVCLYLSLAFVVLQDSLGGKVKLILILLVF